MRFRRPVPNRASASTIACAAWPNGRSNWLCRRAQVPHRLRSTGADNANIQDWIAEARIDIEMIRLLTLEAAYLVDTVGNKQAQTEIAAIQGRRADHCAQDRGPGHSGAQRRGRHR